MKRNSSLVKTRLEEVQDRMMWRFSAAMILLFLAGTAGGCCWLAWRAKDWRSAWCLGTVAVVLLPWLWLQLRMFVRLGDEEQRLQLQQPEDPLKGG